MNILFRRITIAVLLLFCLATVVTVLQFRRVTESLASGGRQIAGLPSTDVSDAFYTVLPTPTISTPDKPPANFVPSCSFPVQLSTESVVLPPDMDDVNFAEPQPIINSTVSVDIVDWLKDSDQLLIRRLENNLSSRKIELWNATTGEIQPYGEQPLTANRPIWLRDTQAIAYQNWAYTDEKSGLYQWNLWLESGKGSSAQLVVSDLLGKNISISDSGEIVQFASNKEDLFPLPELASKYFKQVVVPADLSYLLQPRYPLEAVPEGYLPKQLNVESSLDGSKLALFANPYLYLLDTTNNSICEVALGSELVQLRYPLYVQWSPNSRLLAMITTQAAPGALIEFTEITLLDTLTGEQRQIPTKGNPVALAWSPDNRRLLALIRIDDTHWRPFDKLTLVDTWTGENQELFSDQIFGGGTTISEPGLLWSTDGKMVFLKCSEWPEGTEIIEDRICLILNQAESPD